VIAGTTVLVPDPNALDGGSLVARPDHAVWIGGDGRIRAVGRSDDVIAQARDLSGPGAVAHLSIADLSGAVVIPGLINAHQHFGLALPGPLAASAGAAGPAEMVLRMADAARRTLLSGVTTVRLVGERGFNDIALRSAIAVGSVVGPRVLTACHALCCTGGHGHGIDAVEADGADGFRRAVREQLRAGADLIKVCISGGIAGEFEKIDTPQLTDDEMAAVIDTAHAWGRVVTAHAGPAEAVERAVRLGLDGVEHGYRLTEGVCELMAAQQVWYTPTITVSRCEAFYKAIGVPPWMLDRALAAGPDHWQSLQWAVAAGVPIAMGTDMPAYVDFDGTTATVREMEFMVDAGMTAASVLASATSRAARCLGRSDVGSIQVDARADLLVLDGDPLAEISALRDIHCVIKDGMVYRDDRRSLNVGPRP
jgi:imidazolonepropionase-like amidohydrolase